MTSSNSSSDMLNKLCMIVAFDGYDKKFQVIEMAYFSFTNPKVNKFFVFNLREDSLDGDYSSSSEDDDDEKYKYILKRAEDSLEEILTDIYAKNKTTDKFVVGYVGDNEEKGILDKLDIPSINIKEFRCPNLETLVENFTFTNKSDKLLCRHHYVEKFTSDENEYMCPKLVTICYGKWLLEQISNDEREQISVRDTLNKICMFVAFNGYDKEFPYVEMAYFSITNPKQLKRPNESFKFNLREAYTYIENLSSDEEIPENEEYYLKETLRDIYAENKTTDKYLVGYISEKYGGNYEKNLLDKLEIPSINIEEEIDFPDRLVEDFKLLDKRDKFLCARHKDEKSLKIEYFCPKLVTACFGKWLLKQFSINDMLKKICMVVGFYEKFDEKGSPILEMAYFSLTNPKLLRIILPNESFQFNLHNKHLLEEILRDIYKLNKTTDKYLVAYEGYGHKSVLDKLEIPNVYMHEFYGPDKALIIEDFKLSNKYDKFLCEYHKVVDKSCSKKKIEYFCPKLLTVCYGKWLLEQISKLDL